MGKRWWKGRVLEPTSTPLRSYKTSPRTPALPAKHNLFLLEEQDLHPVARWAGTDLPRRKMEGQRLPAPAHHCASARRCSVTRTQQIRRIFQYISLPYSLLCSVWFSAFSISHTTSKAARWIRLKNLSLCFSLAYIGRCAVTQLSFAYTYTCCIYSCKSTSPPGTTRLLPRAQAAATRQLSATSGRGGWEGAACPYARQGAKPWERLGAGSRHRGRSGSTSKTWVTSSFKGGTVPREPAVRLLPLISFWEARAGGERGLPPGFAIKQKGTEMSNPTNSCLDWKIK